MIALDTNVLVRFLVRDDPQQTAQARALLKRSVDADRPCFVSEVVLCEVIWVLRSRYRLPKAEIVDAVRKLLRVRHLEVQSTERAARALDAYAAGRGDFADYMIREQARSAGYEEVATFDKALHDEQGFLPV